MNKSNLEIFSKQIADLSKILYICIYILWHILSDPDSDAPYNQV